MKSPLRIVLGTALLGTALLYSACGGMAQKPQSASAGSLRPDRSAESDDESMAIYSNDPREAIAQLSSEISDLRESRGMPREPSAAPVREAHDTPTPSSVTTEELSGIENPVCRRTCTIASNICRNSTKICNLATELDGDAWADEKCDSGKVSCEEAKTACKGCN